MGLAEVVITTGSFALGATEACDDANYSRISHSQLTPIIFHTPTRTTLILLNCQIRVPSTPAVLIFLLFCLMCILPSQPRSI